MSHDKTMLDVTKGYRSVEPQHGNNVSVAERWTKVVKRTIARFVRGNIPAQWERLLLPEEQEDRHKRARRIAERWRNRAA